MEFPPWHWRIPEYFNIGTACSDAHLGTPIAERVAMVVDDDRGGVQQLSFAELAERTSRFAELLRDLGVAAGERVLIRLPNCLAYPTVFLGAMKRGTIPVPTSPLLTGDEVSYLARDSGATVLVVDAASWRSLGGRLGSLPAVKHILTAQLVGAAPGGAPAASPDPGALAAGPAERAGSARTIELEAALDAITRWHEAHPTRADEPAYLVYTSGTTGYPKGVLHAHRALLGRQPSSEYWFDFRPEGERVLHSGKLNWTYVLGTGMMDPLYRGHTAILHEGSNDAALWPRLIARHEATTFIGVPTLYRQILQKTRSTSADVPSLRHCMSAGEHLTEELLAGWSQRFGLEIYEGLGMTEFSYYLCQTRQRPIRYGSPGFAQPGHDVKLLDPASLHEVAAGEEGMLCIPCADPGLLLRYWNQPEETAAHFKGDWFLTGDYARRDADGYFWFLGRKDDQIKSFGYRVSPHEVERVLKENPEVADAAVVGEEVAPGKTLVAAHVVRLPESRATADQLLDWAREHLASYKAPKVLYLVDELPRTANGKLMRRALDPGRALTRSSPPSR